MVNMANKIIKFSTPDCNFCKMVNNFLEDNADDIKVEIQEVNPFDEPELAGQYEIQGIPVLILVDEEGKKIKKTKGFNPEQLEDIIQG
jgi:thioredoxin-like negative regulator of GroEL